MASKMAPLPLGANRTKSASVLRRPSSVTNGSFNDVSPRTPRVEMMMTPRTGGAGARSPSQLSGSIMTPRETATPRTVADAAAHEPEPAAPSEMAVLEHPMVRDLLGEMHGMAVELEAMRETQAAADAVVAGLRAELAAAKAQIPDAVEDPDFGETLVSPASPAPELPAPAPAPANDEAAAAIRELCDRMAALEEVNLQLRDELRGSAGAATRADDAMAALYQRVRNASDLLAHANVAASADDTLRELQEANNTLTGLSRELNAIAARHDHFDQHAVQKQMCDALHNVISLSAIVNSTLASNVAAEMDSEDGMVDAADVTLLTALRRLVRERIDSNRATPRGSVGFS
jgi:hypothetical protein